METSKPVKGLIVSRDEDSLDEQKVRNHTYRRREDLEKFERIRLSALLDQHAKSTKKLDKESRALDCLVLLMNSKNFKHLKALLKNDATPDDFKILICDYFIRERCMEINGLIGENLMVILSDYIKYVFIFILQYDIFNWKINFEGVSQTNQHPT